jgi:hypothetical protein
MLSNMCKLIFLVLFLQACASNRNIKEYIIDTKYNQAIGGYKKGTLFEINREYWYKDYISDSLTVETDIFPNVDRKTSKLYRIDFNGNNNHRYTTSKGIKVGDSSQKVEKIYGKPIARKFSPGYLPGGYLLEFPGLLYKNMFFLIDSSTQQVTAFSIGDFSHSW